jgi:hypothetical protein
MYCHLKHAVEGKIEGRIKVTGRRGIRRKQLLVGLKKTGGYCKIERGSTRSHSVGNSLWKRLWTCRNAEYGMNE